MKALNEDVSTANLNATPAAMKIVAKTGQNSVHKKPLIIISDRIFSKIRFYFK